MGLRRRCDTVAKQPVASKRASAQPSQAARAVSDSKREIDSVAAIFDLDYSGLIRTVETGRRPLKALAEYRLSRFFGVKRLSDASQWLQGLPQR